jgi:predicted RNA-binding Zn ribbon-like protein
MSSSSKKYTRKLEPETTHLWGGSVCLDFANTVDWSEHDEPLSPDTDVLGDPDDLQRWGTRLGIFASSPPELDDRELRAAHAQRQAIYHAFAALARGHEPPNSALERIVADYAVAANAGRLSASADAWRLQWPIDDPRRVRFVIAVDALALLADSARLSRVRRCPGRGCGWLFLNTSGRRRWCSMTTCGSREKMRRLYQRQHPPASA